MSGGGVSISAMLNMRVETDGQLTEERNMRFSYFRYNLKNVIQTINGIEKTIKTLAPQTMNDMEYVLKFKEPDSESSPYPLNPSWMAIYSHKKDIVQFYVDIKRANNPRNNIKVFFVNLRWNLGKGKIHSVKGPPENIEIFMINTGSFYTLPTMQEPTTKMYVEDKIKRNPRLIQIPRMFDGQIPVFACICNNEIFEDLQVNGEWLKYEVVISKIRQNSEQYGTRISAILRSVPLDIDNMTNQDTPQPHPRVVNFFGEVVAPLQRAPSQRAASGHGSERKFAIVLRMNNNIPQIRMLSMNKVLWALPEVPRTPEFKEKPIGIYKTASGVVHAFNATGLHLSNPEGTWLNFMPLENEILKRDIGVLAGEYDHNAITILKALSSNIHYLLNKMAQQRMIKVKITRHMATGRDVTTNSEIHSKSNFDDFLIDVFRLLPDNLPRDFKWRIHVNNHNGEKVSLTKEIFDENITTVYVDLYDPSPGKSPKRWNPFQWR